MVLSQLGMGILSGLVILLLAPALLRPTRFAAWVGNAYSTIAMQTLNRPSIMVGTNTDLSLRKRAVDDEFDAEEISVGDETKKITRTPGTTLRWGNRPFTFVDGRFGSTFDLRDVAFGLSFVEAVRDGRFAYHDWIRNDEGEIIDVQGYVRGVLQPEADGPLPMTLEESVRPMIDGAEDATAWDRVYEGVKRMFLPYQSNVSVLKLALPGIMLFAGVMGGYYLIGPGQLPGSPSGRTVSVGAGAGTILLLGIGGDGDGGGRPHLGTAVAWVREWWAVALAVLAIVGAVVAGLFFAPVSTVLILVGILAAIGGSALGSAAILSALPAALCEPIAEAWLTLAFFAFDDPIIEQSESKTIQIVEGDGGGERYRFCKAFVGFDLDVTPDTFGRAGMRGSELGQLRSPDVAADGGVVPAEHEVTDRITSAEHEAFIPEFDEEQYRETFVRTDRWLARFADASTGLMCERAQQQATKEFAGGEPPISDRRLLVLSIGAGIGGLVASGLFWGLLL